MKCFQDNWDVEASDFTDMLIKSLANTSNLFESQKYFPARMIKKFSEAASEEVRAMFISLFDERQDVYDRIRDFKTKSTNLLDKYGNSFKNHFQTENAISTYLWLRYPDKYYIYKFSEVRKVAEVLDSRYHFEKGAYADNIRNFLEFYDEIREQLK